MTKVTTDYEKAKIVVDCYSPNTFGTYVCSCYTPNAPKEIEPEYLVKTVTYKELKEHYADSNGKVNISHTDGSEEYISFEKHINQSSRTDIEWMCAEVINKREDRKYYYSPENLKLAS